MPGMPPMPDPIEPPPIPGDPMPLGPDIPPMPPTGTIPEPAATPPQYLNKSFTCNGDGATHPEEHPHYIVGCTWESFQHLTHMSAVIWVT